MGRKSYAAWSARLNECRAVGKTRDEAIYNVLVEAGAHPGLHEVRVTPQTETGDAAAAAKSVVVSWKSIAKIERNPPASWTPATVGGVANIHEMDQIREVLAPALGLPPDATSSSALHLARRIAELFKARTASGGSEA